MPRPSTRIAAPKPIAPEPVVSKSAPPKAAAPKAAAPKLIAPKPMADGNPSPHGLWFCNWKIWLEARRLLDEALEPLGLKSRDFWILAIAGAGDISQNEMAELCGVDPSSLVAVLDGMERRGMVHRERNPNDRRVQWVRRTKEGDRLYARALPRAQQAETRQLAPLSTTGRRQLLAAMQQLIARSK